MSDLVFVFVLLPCVGAVVAGAVLWDWRLAAAAFFGALGLLFISPAFPEALRVMGGSVVSGVAVGSLALAILLYLRQPVSVWTRMSTSMIAAFVLHYAHLFTIGAA